MAEGNLYAHYVAPFKSDLNKARLYHVEKIEISASDTKIKLAGDELFRNAVFFDFYKIQKNECEWDVKPCDIYAEEFSKAYKEGV